MLPSIYKLSCPNYYIFLDIIPLVWTLKNCKGGSAVVGFLVRWILSIVGIIIITYIVDGFEVTISGAVIGSIVLGILNAVVRPIIILLTLPINVLTLGLFTLVINGFILWLVGLVVRGFEIHTFWAALIAALLLMVINSVLNLLIRR